MTPLEFMLTGLSGDGRGKLSGESETRYAYATLHANEAKAQRKRRKDGRHHCEPKRKIYSMSIYIRPLCSISLRLI